MGRIIWVAIVLALGAAMVASSASASVPDPSNSGWGWLNLKCDKVFICPAADSFIASAIFVSVRDQFDAPMPGVLVEASFVEGGCLQLCGPVSSVTQADGAAILLIHGGLDVSADTACCVVETTVSCMGVQIPHCSQILPPPPSGCVPTDTREWFSADMSQSMGSETMVEALDYAIFSSDWLSSHCRSDYNCDGTVEGLDYSVFSLHWLHSCF